MREQKSISEIMEEILLMADDAEYQALSDQEEALSRQLSGAVDDNDYERVWEIQDQREALNVKMESLFVQKKNGER